MQCQRCQDGLLRIALTWLVHTEGSHQSIALVLQHFSTVFLNELAGELVHLVDYLQPVFRIELLSNAHRADHIAEENGQDAALEA